MPHIVSNINACTIIVDSVKTTLGPFGRDKVCSSSTGFSAVPFVFPCPQPLVDPQVPGYSDLWPCSLDLSHLWF